MTMKPWALCLNTSTIKPQPLLEKVRLVGEAGYDGIELWINDLYEHIGRGGEIRDVEKAIADQGLGVPCMIALRAWGEASELEYPLMLDEARRRLELAARLGSPYLVCSPPREPCDPAQIASRYVDLLELGREIGRRLQPIVGVQGYVESSSIHPAKRVSVGGPTFGLEVRRDAHLERNLFVEKSARNRTRVE